MPISMADVDSFDPFTVPTIRFALSHFELLLYCQFALEGAVFVGCNPAVTFTIHWVIESISYESFKQKPCNILYKKPENDPEYTHEY